MPLSALAALLSALLLLLLLGGLLLILRYASPGRGARALADGDRRAALDLAVPDADREDMLAAVVAARQLGRLARARAIADDLIRLDPEDGEARLERGLVLSYAGELDAARDDLAAAARLRADLGESIALHLAWTELRAGRRAEARRRFEEIEIPLETKLRTDLGAGDPVFCEWFLQAADLWRASGAADKAAWARRQAAGGAAGSRLDEIFTGPLP